MKTIELHGALAEQFGREHRFDVVSASEAICALTYQLDGFEEHFREGHYEIICGPISYGPDNLTFAFRDRLHIYPVPAGSKKGGAGKLILGIALIGLAFAGGVGLFGVAAKGFLTTAVAGGGFKATLIGGAIKYFGVSAALGGAAQLLSPKPKLASPTTREASNPSMLINGAIQTTEEGGGIPICLGGPFMCGSHVVSGGLYVEEVDIAPTGGYGGGGYGTGGGGGVYEGSYDGNFYTTGSNALHYDRHTMIMGAKGGKGGGATKVAKEAANTLMSEMSAKITDLVSVGECYGWADPVNPLRCYFMDETPIERDDGSGGNYANFKGLEVHTRLGTPGQDYIPGFTEQTGETTVETTVTYGPSNRVIRSITDTSLDAVRLKLMFPTMTNQDTKTGDLNGSQASYQIGVRATGWADFEWVVVRTLAEKFTAPLQVAHRIELPPGEGPWDIAVERISPDSTDIAIQNSFSWFSYTRIVDAKLTHPGSAVVGTNAAARQFGDKIPNRGFLWKGIICSVPTNYDTETRKYDGVWDGTWKRAWTNNGVWVTHEVMTNLDWGFGKYISSSLVNKWAFYEAAKICDQPVPDGKGGYEPRWTMAAWSNTVEDARTYIQALCSNFLGAMLWGRGAVQVTQDCRKKARRVVTNANVIDGKFVYEGVGRKAIYTVALVTWNDPDNFYKPRIETVEASPELIAKYGRRTKDVFAFGTTSRGQARRHGLWEIYKDLYGNPFVTYKAGLDHAQVIPGDVVDVADVNDQGIRMGGRIKSTTGLNVELDTEFEFQVGKSYVIEVALETPIYVFPSYARSVIDEGVGDDYIDINIQIESDDRWAGTVTQGATVKTIQQVDGSRIYLEDTVGINEGPITVDFTMSDGSSIELNVVERVVTSPAGLTANITIDSTLPVMTEEYNYVFGLKTDDLVLATFTVLSFEETGDDQFEIVGLKYVPEVFDLIEDGKEFTPRATTIYDTTIPADPPLNLDATYRIVQTPAGGREYIELSFEKSDAGLVTHYEVFWRYANGAWIRAETATNVLEVPYRGPGTYEFSVSAVPAYGKQSAPVYYTKVVGPERGIPEIEIENVRLLGFAPGALSFSGPTLKVEWDVRPPAGYDTDPVEGAITDGWVDPFLRDYEVRVSLSGGYVLNSYFTTDRVFHYSAEMLKEDLGSTVRDIKIEVRLRDKLDHDHPWSTARIFTNPAPLAPSFTSSPSVTGFSLQFTASEDLDFLENCVWIGDTVDVDVDRAPDIQTSQNVIEINTGAGTDKWVRYGRTDVWSPSSEDCILSLAYNITALSTDSGLTAGNTENVGVRTAAEINNDLDAMADEITGIPAAVAAAELAQSLAEEARDDSQGWAVKSESAAQGVISVTRNPFFDQGLEGWDSFGQWDEVAVLDAWQTVIRSNSIGSASLYSEKITIPPTGEPRFRLKIQRKIMAGTAPLTSYAGVFFYDANDDPVTASDGSGNYPLGPAYVGAVGTTLTREVIVGRGGTVPPSPYGGTTTIPAAAVYMRLFTVQNYTGVTGAQVAINYFSADDVTSEVAAGSSASASAFSASVASTKADEASGSSASAATYSGVAANVVGGGLNPNSGFDNYPTPTGFPANITGWSHADGSVYTRVVDVQGGYAMRMVSAAGAEQGNRFINSVDPIKNGQWVVMEGSVRLEAGSLHGAGILVQFFNSAGTVYLGGDSIYFPTDLDTTGAAVGAGEVGKLYHFSKITQVPINLVNPAGYFLIYNMGHYSGFAGAGAVAASNQLLWEKSRLRPATRSEIEQKAAHTGFTDLSGKITNVEAVAANATSVVAGKVETLEAKASSANLLKRSQFTQLSNGVGYGTADDYAPWTAGGDIGAVASLYGWSTAWAPAGEYPLVTIQNVAGGTYSDWYSEYIPAKAGQRYGASVYSGIYNASLTGSTGIIISFYDVNQTAIGYSDQFPPAQHSNTEGWPGGPTLNQFKRLTDFGTAPAGTCYIRLIMRRANLGVNSYTWWVRPMVYEALSSQNQTDVAPYAPSASEARIQLAMKVASDIEGRVESTAGLTVSAGNRIAGMRFHAVDGTDVNYSSIDFFADVFRVWDSVTSTGRAPFEIRDGGVRMKAAFVDRLAVGVSLTVGSTNLKVAVQPFDMAVTDGVPVAYGYDIGTPPNLDFKTTNLVALGTGEVYKLYADSLTSTGFTPRLKIETPGAPTTVTLGPTGNSVGSTPYELYRYLGGYISMSGDYTVRVTGTIRSYFSNPQYNPSGAAQPPDGSATQDGTMDIVFHGNNGGWVYADTLTVYPGFRNEGSHGDPTGFYDDPFDVTKVVHMNSDSNYMAAGVAFESYPASVLSTMTVTFQYATGSSVRSATPAGQISSVTVRPKNA